MNKQTSKQADKQASKQTNKHPKRLAMFQMASGSNRNPENIKEFPLPGNRWEHQATRENQECNAK
jgi:hypothetical protein